MAKDQLSLPSELLFDDFSIIGEDRHNKSLYRVSSSSFFFEEEEEEENEEEDYMAGLTKKMVSSFSLEEEPPREVAGSPHSTLCSWLASSSKGSSDGGDSPVEGRRRQQGEADEAWDSDDLLPEAAGQVMHLKLNRLRHLQSFFGTDQTSPAPADAASQTPPGKKAAGTGYFVSPILIHRQLQAEKFYQLKEVQIIKHQQLKSGGGRGRRSGIRLTDMSPTAWPPLKRQQLAVGMGNGMRAVFLKTSSGTRNEPTTGTGVFLPRTPGGAAAAEPPKKPSRIALAEISLIPNLINDRSLLKFYILLSEGCSTVLVPAKVVQALNLNLERLVAQPCYSGSSVCAGDFDLDHDATISRRKSPSPASDRRPEAEAQGDSSGGEIRLPQEWTY